MALASTELLGPAPARPLAGCTVDDRWIVCAAYDSQSGALLTRGTYTIFDADSGALGAAVGAYSGLGGTIVSICEHNGAAWVGSDHNKIHRVRPDGTLSTWTIPAAGGTGGVRVVSDGGTGIWVAYLGASVTPSLCLFVESTEMFGTPVATGTCYAIARVASTLYVFSASAIEKRSATTGALISTVTPGVSMGFNSIAVIDGDVWWGQDTRAMRYRTATDTLTVTNVGSTIGYVPAKRADGLIYFVQGNTVHTIDPVTMMTAVDALPISRANRYSAFSARGRVYFPSGAPF